jgi:DNA invertase Pin-like site-specific DNA recombinase
MNAANRRAAQYVRMSTELQQYSTANQMARIAEYAEANALTIVKTYLDEGKTGLKIQGRKGLQQLLADVVANEAPYEVIVVYDISRWGRFQDNDESAHYEFLCRRAGKQVIYCAETFSNDGSTMASIFKGLKRAMASEYSRELSDKVFRGQSNLARLGWHVGARGPYGMRRMMISPTGKPRGTMDFGERKSLQSDKVILVPGPPEEIDIVRKIFDWFLTEKIYYQSIADRLKSMRVTPPAYSSGWSKDIVKNILRNPKYLGTMIYNRTTERLSTPKRKNPRSAWIIKEQAFDAIIDRRTYERAQRRIQSNIRVHKDQYLQESLRRALAQHGRLSISALKATKGAPSAIAYRRRYGTMTAAYATIGYTTNLDPVPVNRKKNTTLVRVIALIARLKMLLQHHGLSVTVVDHTTMIINRRLVLLVRTFLHNESLKGYQLFFSDNAHWTLALLPSDRFTETDMEFYLLPQGIVPGKTIYFYKKRPLAWLHAYAVHWETLADVIRSALAEVPLDIISIGRSYAPPEDDTGNISEQLPRHRPDTSD